MDSKEKVKKIINDRDWEKFHTLKDIAISISVESNELLQEFLWKKDEEINLDNIENEIGDIIFNLVNLSNRLNLNMRNALNKSLSKIEKKYPIQEFKGKNNKYNIT